MMKDFKVEAVSQVQFLDVTTGQADCRDQGARRGVSKVAFSRDNKLLASGVTDNTIKIWDVATRNELRTLTGHTSAIESIDFSPDGRCLLQRATMAARFSGTQRPASTC
jgi:WD40 repeat protein